MSVQQVIIRDLGFDDIIELTLLINELGYHTSVNEMESRFKIISAHPDYKTIVAVANGEIVGVSGLCKGIFYEKNGMYMRILVFIVKQNSRKKGIGKLLIRACEDWAAEQGLNTILINSGNREERIDAHEFYKEMGYAIKSSGFVKHL